MVNSLFAAEKIDKERRVVLEELNGRLEQPGHQGVRPVLDRGVRRPSGPQPADRQPRPRSTTPTREVLVQFRDTYFVASNMVVAVVGDVEHEEIFEKLADAFAGMRTGPAPPSNAAPVPPLVPRIAGGHVAGQQARVIAGGPTVGHDSPDRHVLDVIEAIMGNSGRRLERELVDTQAIASSAYAFYFPLTDVGVWGISVGCRAGRRRPRDRSGEGPASGASRDARRSRRSSTRRRRTCEVRRCFNRERSVDLAEELSDGEALGTYEPIGRRTWAGSRR